MPSLTKKIIRGKPYYYLRECQRVDGKPKIVSTIYLGPPQTILERLMRPEPAKVALREFGASAAVFDIARSLDVVATIDRHVPKRGSQGASVGQYLLVAAINRCVAPCSKAQIGDWYEKTVLRRLLPLSAGQLTSQRFWDNMERVTTEQIAAIEQDLASVAVSRFGLDLRCLLFDATNFFTFLDSFNGRAKLPQRGHSKDGRDNLRILGLALLVASDGEVPLFHHTYAGNQHDSVTFKSVAEELFERCRSLAQGACDITLVFDKGNNSKDNLELVGDSSFHFVGSLVPTQHQDLLGISRKQMRRLDKSRLPAVWSYRTRKVVFGVERTVLCTFNKALFDSQTKTLSREIRKRTRRLQTLKLRLARRRKGSPGKAPTVDGVQNQVKEILRGRHMAELFAVKLRKSSEGLPRLSFRCRDKAYHHLSSTLLGKTIIFTDRTDWTDEQILLAYRAQHHVEANFRRLKDPHYLTFRPTFHWTDQKLRVHTFYCVLALMMLNMLRRKLAQAGTPLSVVKMMDMLADIHEITLLYPATSGSAKPFARTVLSDMEPTQRKLVDTLTLERYRSA
ncbi:MAG: IS1634 family transposase [Candidatus Methylomirabilaceae bacterium]